jgi:ABC-type uncharacterized transport system involved in gliding motility auxiliary subunit
MRKTAGFWGILGAVMVLFGVIGGLLLGSFRQPLLIMHLVLGTVFLLSWIFAAGLKNVADARSMIRGRTARFGANAILYSLVFVGFLIVANWFANRYDRRWDLTEAGVFSLSSQSIQVIEKLDQPLRLVGFDLGENKQQIEELLRLYKLKRPDKVQTEMVDPRVKPHLVEKYGMKRGNVLYLSYGSEDKPTVSRVNEVTEEAVTNAIIKLTRGAARKIYYLQGHGEPNLRGTNPTDLKLFTESLEDEHFKIEEIVLSTQGGVPQDAAAIMVVAPQQELLPQEIEILTKYAQNGGRLVLFHDPRTTNDIVTLAASFGMKVGDNIVIDQVQRLLAAPVLGAEPVVREYANHAITREFGQNTITLFNIASTVTKVEDAPAGATITELLKTSPTSWAETNIEALFGEEPQASQDPNDLSGPVSLAAVFEKKIEGATDKEASGLEKTSRVVVFGDSDWIRNSGFQSFGNRDLALNTVNWSIGLEGGISIRPKSIRESAAPIPEQTFLTILASSFLIPELILIVGLLIWWRRRQLSVA